MHSRVHGLKASCSLVAAPPLPRSCGVVAWKQTLSEVHQGRLRSVSENAAVRVDSVASGPMMYSPHPDAVRRRREAEERQIQRAAALEATLAATRGKSTYKALPNLYEIFDPSELRLRLTLGSRDDNLVVAHFKAAWCSACARMQYKVGQIAEQNPDVTFLIIDISKNPDLLEAATELGVEDLPSFMFFKNGRFLSQIKCNLSRINILRAEIAGHKNFEGGAQKKEVCPSINA